MNLKRMREQLGLKQSELAAISGVNLRSLQDYEQGHKSICSAKGDTLLKLSRALGYSIEEILIESSEFTAVRSGISEQTKNRIIAYENRIRERSEKQVRFPVIAPDESVDMSRIYPTKQVVVKSVLTLLRTDNRVNSLRLFGSSITLACHSKSDVDFAVGLNDTSKETRNDISEKIQKTCDWGADIIWLDRLSDNELIYKKIMKGLVLI